MRSRAHLLNPGDRRGPPGFEAPAVCLREEGLEPPPASATVNVFRNGFVSRSCSGALEVGDFPIARVSLCNSAPPPGMTRFPCFSNACPFAGWR
jgi:hypothetical protein